MPSNLINTVHNTEVCEFWQYLPTLIIAISSHSQYEKDTNIKSYRKLELSKNRKIHTHTPTSSHKQRSMDGENSHLRYFSVTAPIIESCSLFKGADLSQFSSVAQSFLTLQPHGLHYARLSCPSPTSGACSNLCSSSR